MPLNKDREGENTAGGAAVWVGVEICFSQGPMLAYDIHAAPVQLKSECSRDASRQGIGRAKTRGRGELGAAWESEFQDAGLFVGLLLV